MDFGIKVKDGYITMRSGYNDFVVIDDDNNNQVIKDYPIPKEVLDAVSIIQQYADGVFYHS